MTPEELTQAREALGLRQIELARLLETTGRTVRAWENGTPRWRIPFAVAALMRLAVKSAMVRRELGIKSAPRAQGQQTPPR